MSIIITFPMTAIRNSISANPAGVYDPATGIIHADHGLLAGLADDDHTQYALLAGRVGQSLISNLVGNVTGNCSGSSGSCTGNSASATLWGAYAAISGPTAACTYTFPDTAATMLYDGKTSGVLATLYGSVASGGNLTLQSTSHATKGKILFGNSGYDEVNNRLGIGTSSPAVAVDVVNGAIRYAGASYTIGILLENTTAAATSSPNLQFKDGQASPQSLYMRKGGDQLVVISNAGVAEVALGTNLTNSYFNGGGNLGLGTSTFGTSAAKVFAVGTGTPPSTSPADMFQMYSADQVAGNACPFFRTENGAVIKLYKLAAYTQTYATASRTVPNATASNPPDGGTGTAAGGYDTAANRNAMITSLTNCIADVAALKQVVNSLIDDLQALGLAA